MKKHRKSRFTLFLAAAAIFSFAAGAFFSARDNIRLDAFAFCGSKNSDHAGYLRCVREYVPEMIAAYGLPKTMARLKASVAVADSSSEDVACHDAAHLVGEAAIGRAGQLGATLAQCGRSCGYGCIHGAVSGEILQKGGMPQDMNSVCTIAVSNFTVQDKSACNHGLGHAAASLAELDLIKSLSFCDGLSDGNAKEECYSGVFMEIFDAPTGDHEPQKLPGDLARFCSGLSASQARFCLRTSGSILFRRSQDAAQGFRVCRTLPPDLRNDCVSALGADAYFVFDGDPQKIADACALGADLGNSCFDGAVFSSFVNDPTANEAEGICAAAKDAFKSACATAVERNKVYINAKVR